jgi:hypothetical protein
MMSDWRHKDVWDKRGKHFLVRLRRHSNKQFALVDGEFKYTDIDEHKWCLYAFIYPDHTLFGNFDGPDFWQDACGFFDWHGGCTYLEYHRDDESKIVSVQVGCDYNHYLDDRYLYMATKEDAASVFNDADGLFEVLSKEING